MKMVINQPLDLEHFSHISILKSVVPVFTFPHVAYDRGEALYNERYAIFY
jgi:hypothetical protein